MVGTEDFIMTAFAGSLEECHKVTKIISVTLTNLIFVFWFPQKLFLAFVIKYSETQL